MADLPHLKHRAGHWHLLGAPSLYPSFPSCPRGTTMLNLVFILLLSPQPSHTPLVLSEMHLCLNNTLFAFLVWSLVRMVTYCTHSSTTAFVETTLCKDPTLPRGITSCTRSTVSSSCRQTSGTSSPPPSYPSPYHHPLKVR